jgi:hypothetical protein
LRNVLHSWAHLMYLFASGNNAAYFSHLCRRVRTLKRQLTRRARPLRMPLTLWPPTSSPPSSRLLTSRRRRYGAALSFVRHFDQEQSHSLRTATWPSTLSDTLTARNAGSQDVCLGQTLLCVMCRHGRWLEMQTALRPRYVTMSQIVIRVAQNHRIQLLCAHLQCELLS